MASFNAQAFYKRLREVIDDGLGSVRTVPNDRIAGNLPAGLTPTAQFERTINRPRFDCLVTHVTPSDDSPPGAVGSIALLDVEFELRFVYALPLMESPDEERDNARAIALEDMDLVRQALEWHDQLSATDAGVSTQIIRGSVRMVSFDVSNESFAPDQQVMRTVHRYTSTVQITQATS